MKCTYEGRCENCPRLYDTCDGDEEYQDVDALRDELRIIGGEEE